MADALLLSSQRVTPVRSAAEGFACRYPLLEQSLEHILG
jgi:NAD dependent epimerase/dehydratase family enzyme